MASSVDEKVANFDSVSTKHLSVWKKASSMALTVATLTDCRLECANKYQLVFTSVEEVFAKPFLSSIMKSK